MKNCISAGKILHGFKHPFKNRKRGILTSCIFWRNPCITYSNILWDAKILFPGVSYGGSRCWAVPDFASHGATERFVGVESLRAGTELWNGRLAVGSFKQLGPTWSQESYGISDYLEFGLRKTHRNPKKTPKCFWGQKHVSPQIAVLYIIWLASDLLVYYIRLEPHSWLLAIDARTRQLNVFILSKVLYDSYACMTGFPWVNEMGSLYQPWAFGILAVIKTWGLDGLGGRP